MARIRSSGPVAVFSGGGTGGHLYPALALADALRRLRTDVRVVFLGAAQGVEAGILPERGEEHHLLPVRGFRRGKVLENLLVLWALARSLLATGLLFTRLRPALVVVTGGYAGGPAGIMAGIMGIPLALQEQNAAPGVTTKALSRWSRQVHVAFPEARDLLPSKGRAQATLSGNPVRAVETHPGSEARAGFGLAPDSRVVLVTGGSQGAAGINRALLEILEDAEAGAIQRPADVQVLWVTGPKNLASVMPRYEELGEPAWLRVVGYVDDMPKALGLASLAVSRAGAMTTSEFLAWGIPAVLIPLPTAAADHQARNAESLSAAGCAVHVPESELTGPRLWDILMTLLADEAALEAMRIAALGRGRPEATVEIATAMAGLLPTATPKPSEAGPGEGRLSQ